MNYIKGLVSLGPGHPTRRKWISSARRSPIRARRPRTTQGCSNSHLRAPDPRAHRSSHLLHIPYSRHRSPPRHPLQSLQTLRGPSIKLQPNHLPPSLRSPPSLPPPKTNPKAHPPPPTHRIIRNRPNHNPNNPPRPSQTPRRARSPRRRDSNRPSRHKTKHQRPLPKNTRTRPTPDLPSPGRQRSPRNPKSYPARHRSPQPRRPSLRETIRPLLPAD